MDVSPNRAPARQSRSVAGARPATRQLRWRGRASPAAVPGGPYPPLIARLLALRGCATDAEAQAFLYGGDNSGDPYRLPGMTQAVQRLRRACRDGEAVAIFGDFDVDGTTACAILSDGLSRLGARTISYVPDRFTEGYGLNVAAINALRRGGASILVAADCGTSSVAEVAHARGLGMDVIVLDHHATPSALPETNALVNPRLPGADAGSLSELAACGIAFQLLAALYDDDGHALDEDLYLDLVALGTVCDVAPLSGANRDLVRRGLKTLSQTSRPGLAALIQVAGLDTRRLMTEHLGFSLGPRLNAAGRMAHARLALELLTTSDELRAGELARELSRLNEARQQAQQEALALAEELIAGQEDEPVLFVGHPSFSPGIVGLVASRLADAWYRPVVAYEEGERESRASCRSIPEFDITAALREMPELFVRFGGHRQAAGFTALNERLPEIRRRLREIAKRQLDRVQLSPALSIDAALPLRAITGEDLRWLSLLEPHGNGNPEPVFLSRSVEVMDAREVGSDGSHLRLKLRDGSLVWPAIAFGFGGSGVTARQRVDVVYGFSPDRYAGVERNGMQLQVKDLRPSEDGEAAAV